MIQGRAESLAGAQGAGCVGECSEDMVMFSHCKAGYDWVANSRLNPDTQMLCFSFDGTHGEGGIWSRLSCRHFPWSHSTPSCCSGHCVSSSVLPDWLILYTSSFLGPKCGEEGTELREGLARWLQSGYMSFGSVLAPELPSLG